MSFSQPVASGSQHQPTLIEPREASYAPSDFSSASFYSANDEFTGQGQDEHDTGGRFPIRRYVKTCTLPEFMYFGKPSLHRLKSMGYATQWAKYRGLICDVGTRSLRRVERIQTWETVSRVNTVLSRFEASQIKNDPLLEGEPEDFKLYLPAEGLTTFDQKDINTLGHLLNEDDLNLIYKRYILDTASEVWRIMYRYPVGSPIANQLKFKYLNRLCPAHHARWDIFGLPPNEADELPLAVIFIPPWELGLKDFEQLTAVQTFNHGAIDTLDTKDQVASDTIWAVIYEVLKFRGHKFVITNYNYWAFGVFNKEYTYACITDVREATLTDFDGISTPAGLHAGCNVFEMLLIWMQIRDT